MFLETIRALIARFANYNSSNEQPHSSGTAAESTAAGPGLGTGTGPYAYDANASAGNESL